MKVGTQLDRKGVMEVLPHRDPFLFIDRVENILAGDHEGAEGNEAIIGRKIIAFSDIKPEADFFRGHFPGHPIVPGVLLLETMAQASAILAYDPEIHGRNLEVLFVSATDVRFRKPTLPGDVIRVESIASQIRRQFWHFDCRCFNGDQKVSEAHLVASFGSAIK